MCHDSTGSTQHFTGGDAYNGRMPFVSSRLTPVSILLAWVVALGALLGISSAHSARATGDISVDFQVTSLEITAGQDIPALITVTNSTDQDLTAGTALVTVDSTVLGSVSEVEAWLAAADGFTRPGRYLDEVDVPAVPAGQTITFSQTLSQELARFGSVWGPRGLALDYLVENTSLAQARTVTVFATGTAPSAFLGAVVALTPAPDSPGILSRSELELLTGPSGLLTRQLGLAAGRPVTIGIDPRVLNSISLLGNDRPDSVTRWLSELSALPNPTFLLAYADADIAAQAQAGATQLLAPVLPEIPATTGEPSATPGGEPVVAPQVVPTLNNVGWPAASTVVESDLEVFAQSGLANLILSSQNISAGDQRPSRAIVSGFPSVITNSALSEALEDGNTGISAALLAAAALDPSTSGGMFADVSRETFSITELSARGQTLDALLALSWVSGTAPVFSADASAVAVVNTPESDGRVAAVKSLLERVSAVEGFSSVVDQPELISGPVQTDTAAVLSVGWRSDSSWNAAVSAQMKKSFAVLNSVGVVTSSTVNMVGGQVNIPVSVRNDLDQPATVVVSASANNARLLVTGSETITIQPGAQTTAQIPVQAQVSNGSSLLTITLSSPTGVVVGSPASISVNVRADWESWGLLGLGIVFAGLLVAGVVRTVRRKANVNGE
jgi:hypothetical protein